MIAQHTAQLRAWTNGSRWTFHRSGWRQSQGKEAAACSHVVALALTGLHICALLLDNQADAAIVAVVMCVCVDVQSVQIGSIN